MQIKEVCYQMPGFQQGRIPRPMEKTLPNGNVRISCADGCWFQLIDLQGAVHREWPAVTDEPFWLEAAANGDLVFSEQGCLWRWKGFPHGEPELVADLNGMRFKPVPPPDLALEW